MKVNIGDRVFVRDCPVDCACDVWPEPCPHYTGTVIFIEEAQKYKSGFEYPIRYLLEIINGWSSDKIDVHHMDMSQDAYKAAKNKSCWFVFESDIIRVLENNTPKTNGNYCKVCNIFNEYQSEPFICWEHNH